jgi:hypothetical protein
MGCCWAVVRGDSMVGLLVVRSTFERDVHWDDSKVVM